MKNVVLGVTGGVAAYKAAEIANLLTKNGVSVHTILTAAARKFIAPLTFQSLTKNKTYADMFEEIVCEDIRHISLAKKADLVLIAPATANFIGKLAAGIADDMLTTVVAAAYGKPIVICPAMNTAMYENPIIQNNIAKLTKLGYRFIEPKESRLACGDLGKGALANVDVIISAVSEFLSESFKRS
ncbi:MAG: phosphopantothenoylcysteine decarboxylase [Holosporaceae bacterium]|jgi:phosphopantothenoylcysteine decarboxylase/phosphopantothenoylcysteine decarboxylase/phosphopantothenate--cysteine ligase|nr:phosphopantothenoylcysteine decarboxylase [Holosporaceae bacterium]